MHQKLTLVGLGGAIALLAVIAWQTAPAQQRPLLPENGLLAQQRDPAPPPAVVAAKQPPPGNGTPAEVNGARRSTTQLPIAQVILFSSGVGYFQREGEVEGSSRVDLSFPVQDINDLL